MVYSGQFAASGGPMICFITPDGVNVTVAAYGGGQLSGAATLSPTGTTSAVLSGGALYSNQLTVSISSTTGDNPMTALTWSLVNIGQQGPSSPTTATIASWPTP